MMFLHTVRHETSVTLRSPFPEASVPVCLGKRNDPSFRFIPADSRLHAHLLTAFIPDLKTRGSPISTEPIYTGALKFHP
jgi:hypothetical protein